MEQAVLPNQKRNGLGRAALARIKFGQSKTRVQGGKKTVIMTQVIRFAIEMMMREILLTVTYQ